MTDVNRQVLLVRRPHGPVTDDCFALGEAPVPRPGEGEVLVRVLYLSLDPTIRGWLSESGNYLPPVPLGEVVRGFGVGVVVESCNPELPVGALVPSLTGWQEYAVVSPGDLLPPVALPPTVSAVEAVSVYGITGLTAYFGLTEIGRPAPGETVVVSGAAGGVGSIAGQVARILGAGRVVGIAGTDEKCRWLVEELGFDAAIDYKTDDVGARLRETCPDGVDVYFENVGGEILDTVLARLAFKARVILCGAISTYNETGPAPGPRNLGFLVSRHARIEGFLLTHYLDRIFEGMVALGEWVEQGRIVNRVDVVEGLERAPEAFNRLFTGANIGKQLVKVSD